MADDDPVVQVKENCFDVTLQNLRQLVPEMILGFVFWSFFLGLPPAIWFYPLNELDVTGYEVFFLVLLSPVIYMIPHVYELLSNKIGISSLRIVSCLCLTSLQFPTTFSRLVVMSIGTSASLLAVVSSLWLSNRKRRFLTCWGLIFGFMLILVTRIFRTSLLVTWEDSSLNARVVTIAVIATMDRLFNTDYDNRLPEEIKFPLGQEFKDCLFLGMGFGSVLYATVALFGDVSVLSRWCGSGYPDVGPSPNPSGLFVLLALSLGIMLDVNKDPNIAAEFWWTFGTCGLMGLYLCTGYRAFCCGLMFAIYLMSVWPIMIDRMTTYAPGKVFTIAMATYMVEMLFSIWTVAYNFVPGGTFTREHSGYLLAFISLTIYKALCTEFVPTYSRTAFTKLTNLGFARLKVSFVICTSMLFLAGCWGMYFRPQRYPSVNTLDELKENETVRFSALIWTFHFGFDNTGLYSFERSADLLNNTGADVIVLLESDASKPFLGSNDIAMWMGERLGMYSDFGPSTKDHTWGSLILSKYPIVRSRHHLLPSPEGELAPAIDATLDVNGKMIDIVATHMGNDRDNLDRKLQAEYLSKLLNNSVNPVIFLGYVTSAPWSRDYLQLTRNGRTKDIDSSDMDRWCQYIMYRGLVRLGYARISHGGLSDTELQMARFEIPQDNETYVDNDVLETDEDVVPKDQHFNDVFLDTSENYNGRHRYHSGTPKYFLPEP